MRSRSTILICSLVSLAICMVAGDNRCPNPEDIEFFDPKNHALFHCWHLSGCPDGHGRSLKPGSVHPMGTNVECKLCPKETFSSHKTNNTCIKCARCGYNKELSNCTHSQDRQCLRECVSKKYYLNATDGQCYQCSECCGSDPGNVQPHCLASSPFSIGTTVIGQKGATHCGIRASQKCGCSFGNQGRECGYNKTLSNSTSSQDRQCLSECVSKKCYLNTTNGQCYQCSECCGSDPSNIQPHCLASSPFSIGSTVIGQNGATHCGIKASQKCGYSVANPGRESSFKKVMITVLGILGFLLCVSVCVIVWCYIKGRRSSGPSFQSGILCCLSSSSSHSLGNSIMVNQCVPFQKNLKVIPEGVKIDDLPDEVEEIICALDAKGSCRKGWYHVGRKLEISKSVLNRVKREDLREGGSPTNVLLSILVTQENVVSLRKFVQVLCDIGRNDISRKIFNYYHEKQTVSESSV